MTPDPSKGEHSDGEPVDEDEGCDWTPLSAAELDDIRDTEWTDQSVIDNLVATLDEANDNADLAMKAGAALTQRALAAERQRDELAEVLRRVARMGVPCDDRSPSCADTQPEDDAWWCVRCIAHQALAALPTEPQTDREPTQGTEL